MTQSRPRGRVPQTRLLRVLSLAGHTIFYSLADSPLGKKESILDTARVVSRYVDVMTARVNTRQVAPPLAPPSFLTLLSAR